MWTRRPDRRKWHRRRAAHATGLGLLLLVTISDRSAVLAATPREECERLANSESTATATAKSVPFEAIDAATAIPACSAAVEAEPNKALYRFLLSRALLKAQRYSEARQEAEQAIKGGVLGAHSILAAIYHLGLGIDKDPVKARGHFRILAEAGVPSALAPYAQMLETGEGGAKDEVQAARWYRSAAERGDAAAQGRLARLLVNGPESLRNPAEAVGWFEKAAAQGDLVAIYELGDLLIAGRHVGRDPQRGIALFRAAVKSGFAPAMAKLALLRQSGLPGAPDDREAAALIMAAARKEPALGMAYLGRGFIGAKSVEKDPAGAFALFENAVANGGASAETLLGGAYHWGHGTKKNPAEAALIYERAAATGDPWAAALLGHLVMYDAPNLSFSQDRLRALLVTARAAFERALPRSTRWLIIVQADLSELHLFHGEYAEAVALLERSLELAQRSSGPDVPSNIEEVVRLAKAFVPSGRFEEAEAVLERAVSVLRGTEGPENMALLDATLTLASLKARRGQYSTAIALLQPFRSQLAVKKDAPPGLIPMIDAQIAYFLGWDGKWAEADTLLTSALMGIDRRGVIGTLRATIAMFLHADVKARLGKLRESEALYREASALVRSGGHEEHPMFVESAVEFATVLERMGKSEEALVIARQATARYAARLDRQGRAPRAQITAERRAMRETFVGSIQLLALHHKRTPSTNLLAESFENLQLANAASVSESIGHGAARSTAGSDALSKLAFERQATVEKWTRLNRELANSAVQPAGTGEQVTAQFDTMKTLESSLARIDQEIKRSFPAYFDLTYSAPVPLGEVQKLLKPDEALVAYILGRGDVYAWAVTSKTISMRRLDGISARSLEDDIAVVRRGLDPSDAMSTSDLKPVDLARLHALYRQLLAPLGLELGAIRHVLVVPDGPLSALPFHVLVTEPPPGAMADLTGYRKVGWLARKVAITVVPSVGALRALRSGTPSRLPPKPFVGFGDPVFSADGAGAVRGAKGTRRGVPATALARRGSVDLAALRALPSLPDTADELTRIARLFRAEDAVFLQGEASEGRIKSMDLSQYRIVALATHGLISGELNGLDEPALALSVPTTPNASDDGLLMASEVSLLNLNADLVILSACNTASGDGRPGADGLSGLARAFFVAGSRALLVSNWPVFSDAAAEVTTRMFERLKADPSVRRSEALRLAMLDLLDDPGAADHMAHPAAWAPFIVVGDGAALRGRNP